MEADRKSRGAYYTPARVAQTLAAWAVRSPSDRVLDPACGDGAFLREVRSRSALGIEISPRDAAAASRFGQVLRGDFFELVERLPTFDAVVGNPPYIRYQSIPPDRKARIKALCAQRGLDLGGESSTWAAFVGLAATRLEPGGRLAMVVPREALFTNYTRPLLDFLGAHFSSVRVEPQDELLFEGALEKVALLYCDGYGGRSPVADEPWRWRDVPRECRATVRAVLDDFRPLSEVADVRLGLVTGDKNFFVVGDDLPVENRTAVVADPSPLRGAAFTSADFPGTWLLTAPPMTAAARRYIKVGESRGVHLRYKCRIRDPWYALKVGPRPHALLGYCIGERPRLALNLMGVAITNNLHGVFARDADPRELVASFYNPATLLSIELLGRVYGGGVMKIEPGDATRIKVPREFRAHIAVVDRALRAGADAPVAAGSSRTTRLLLRAYRALKAARTTTRASKAS